MQSAWSEGAAVDNAAAGPAAGAARAVRGWLAPAELPTVALVLAVALVVAGSTVAMQWVKGSEIFPGLAALGVVLLSLLALARVIPALLALPVGAAAAVLVPYYVNETALKAAHPEQPLGIPSPGDWVAALSGADSNIDTSFFLFAGCIVMFALGGWLAWCTIRWRRPLLGLFPGAAVFATNVLNSTDEQNANVIYFLILTIGLLLWSGYRANLVSALRSGLRLSSDSRWDFWETGVAATAGVMLLAIFLPPLTHDDQTVNVENGVFRNWAEFEQNLNHQVEFGQGGAASYSTGFALDAGLNSALKTSDKVVFEYTYTGSFSGPRYFRGVNLQNGVRPNQWAFLNNPFGYQFFVARNSTVPYLDQRLTEQFTSTVTVHMLRPPAIAPDVLFYPGELVRTDRDAVAVESYKTGAEPIFGAVDRVTSSHPASSVGFYKATVDYPNPTEDQLRNAGVDYPDWLAPYLAYPGLTGTPAFASSGSGRPGQNTNTIQIVPASSDSTSPTARLIKGLADQVTAGSSDNYDKATAIETYLRSNFTYTLNPPPPKDAATDPLQSFLFDTKQGYCAYFATAMGDMLRAEGIPARLVNGYGPGTYDNKLKQYVVRESDAHTWVEAYFPSYGWIPFEPTPDTNYPPIARAIAPSNCNRDACSNGEDTGPSAVPGGSKTKVNDLPGGDVPDQSGPLTQHGGFPYWVMIPLALLLLGAAAFIFLSRLLRPRTAALAWSRVALLSRLAGHRGPPGETPLEAGRRLASTYPEAAKPLRDLSQSFTVAAYAPPASAQSRAAEVVEGWERVRPHLLRRVVGRFTPAF